MLGFAALMIGSHAYSDAFAVISWRATGLKPELVSALWSEAVFSEILVFFFLGPLLLARWRLRSCALLAAAGGVLRWSALAVSSDWIVLAFAQMLHGLTFSLVHLTCMKVIGSRIPEHLAATAQMIYGTVSLGLASAVLTLASGWIYARYGQSGFWLMAALCAASSVAAVPLKASTPVT
jgi:MFS transporter, PPP family, 3-phenylpropionic acid transporter